MKSEEFPCSYSANRASATLMSKGVVILIFSRLPSTIATWHPKLSTTEASSVN